MPFAELQGRRVHYLRSGEGPPLLLIQGMSGTHLSWGEPFLEELRGDFEVIVFDNRGVGRSDPADEPFSTAELAGEAAELLDELAIDRAHVTGISMGGMVAQELALAHEERILTLTLGCTYCGGPGSALASEADRAPLAAAIAAGDRERAIRAGWEFNLSDGFRADPSRFDAFREMTTRERATVATMGLQLQAILGHGTHDRLPSLRVPAIVIHGTEDKVIPFSNAPLIAGLLDAPLHALEGVGHMFWWEQPERSARLIREHARSVGVTG